MFVDERDEKTTTSGRTDKTTNTNTLPKCSSLPRLLVYLSVCLFVCLSLSSLSSFKSLLCHRAWYAQCLHALAYCAKLILLHLCDGLAWCVTVERIYHNLLRA